MTPQEIYQLAGNGGFIVALIWAVRYLVAQNEQRNRELVEALRGTVEQNTQALLRVEHVLRKCPGGNDTQLLRSAP